MRHNRALPFVAKFCYELRLRKLSERAFGIASALHGCGEDGTAEMLTGEHHHRTQTYSASTTLARGPRARMEIDDRKPSLPAASTAKLVDTEVTRKSLSLDN